MDPRLSRSSASTSNFIVETAAASTACPLSEKIHSYWKSPASPGLAKSWQNARCGFASELAGLSWCRSQIRGDLARVLPQVNRMMGQRAYGRQIGCGDAGEQKQEIDGGHKYGAQLGASVSLPQTGLRQSG